MTRAVYTGVVCRVLQTLLCRVIEALWDDLRASFRFGYIRDIVRSRVLGIVQYVADAVASEQVALPRSVSGGVQLVCDALQSRSGNVLREDLPHVVRFDFVHHKLFLGLVVSIRGTGEGVALDDRFTDPPLTLAGQFTGKILVHGFQKPFDQDPFGAVRDAFGGRQDLYPAAF